MPYPNRHLPQTKTKTFKLLRESDWRRHSPSPPDVNSKHKAKAKPRAVYAASDSSEEEDAADGTMNDDDDDDDDDDDEADAFLPRSKKGKIRKPPGEAGRPKSGGYKLEEALQWKKEDFGLIQVSFNVFNPRRL